MSIIKKLICALAAIATAACFMYITKNKYNAYAIIMNNKVVGYAKDTKDFEKIKNDYYLTLKKNYEDYKYNDNIYMSKDCVKNTCFQSEKAIQYNMNNCTKSKVLAFSIINGGKEIAITSDSSNFKSIAYDISLKYLKEKGYKDITGLSQCVLRGNITYSKKYVSPNEVNSLKESEDKLWTSMSKDSPLYISCKFNEKTNETVNFTKKKEYVSTMDENKSVTKQGGQNGINEVLKEFVLCNNNVIESKIISKTALKSPVDEITSIGTKKPASTISSSNTKVAGLAQVSIPVKGIISSYFGMRWGKMHEGLDIAANMGDPIYAYDKGTIEFAGWETGYGNFIIIRHNDTLETCYGHMSKFAVKKGDSIDKGQLIGYVGSTGNSTGPHVHFEVRVNGVQKDPTSYLK